MGVVARVANLPNIHVIMIPVRTRCGGTFRAFLEPNRLSLAIEQNRTPSCVGSIPEPIELNGTNRT